MKRSTLLTLFAFLMCMGGCARKTSMRTATYRTIDDFSHLNRTIIAGVYAPEDYQALSKIIRYARSQSLKISVAGCQHSQGGQSFYPNGIVITLKKLNKILDIDDAHQRMTVQTGATWKQVQQELNRHNFSVSIMQFINNVTVGGSLSVNANGIDPHKGPLIESVHALKIMLSDGSIVTASRTENPELFSLAIGGYGLFGIILEATIDIVPNRVYRRESETISISEYANFLNRVKNDPSIGFHIGQVVLEPYGPKLFEKIEAIQYKQIDESTLSSKKLKKIKKISPERFIEFKKIGIQLLRTSGYAKRYQRPIDDGYHGVIRSRNTIMSPPASHIYLDPTLETLLLQEYFIPPCHFIEFMDSLERITRTMGINLMHLHVRFIPKNTESFLSYTHQDMVGIVILFSQKLTDHDSKKIALWTRSLIDSAQACDGTYYLPSQLHATHDQIIQCHPKIEEFFKLKTLYDPQHIFSNHFHKKYAQKKTFISDNYVEKK